MAEHTMDEQTSYCPYLSLKRKRGTRLDVPSPEHRCYSNDEPLEIPLSQEEFCLSPSHIYCPLYSGPPQAAPPATGIQKLIEQIPAKDRTTYIRVFVVIIVIANIYIFAELLNVIQGSAPTAAPNGTITATVVPSPFPTGMPTLLPTTGTTGMAPQPGTNTDPNLSVVVTNTMPASVGTPNLFFPVVNR
jgi:hypothetical protein